MNKNNEKIKELLSMDKAQAPDITNSLKIIGDGNMLKGAKTIYNYAQNEGMKEGFIKGSLDTIGLCIIVPKGIKKIKKKIEDKKKNEEMGEKIYNALIEDID